MLISCPSTSFCCQSVLCEQEPHCHRRRMSILPKSTVIFDTATVFLWQMLRCASQHLFCIPPCNSAVQCGWPPMRITATVPQDIGGGNWGGARLQGGGCTRSGTSRIDHRGAVVMVQLRSHCLIKMKCFSNTKWGTKTLTCDKNHTRLKSVL